MGVSGGSGIDHHSVHRGACRCRAVLTLRCPDPRPPAAGVLLAGRHPWSFVDEPLFCVPLAHVVSALPYTALHSRGAGAMANWLGQIWLMEIWLSSQEVMETAANEGRRSY